MPLIRTSKKASGESDPEYQDAPELELETTKHTYFVTDEDGEALTEPMQTTDAKITKVVRSSLSDRQTAQGDKIAKVTPPNLRDTQAIMRLAILQKTGGITGIIDTLEDARTGAVLPGTIFPDHKTRIKASEVELRLMGLMGAEAAAAVEESKADKPIFADEDKEVHGESRIEDFLRRVKARQMDAEPDEINFKMDEAALERLSPASVGKSYQAPKLPRRIIESSKRVLEEDSPDTQESQDANDA